VTRGVVAVGIVCALVAGCDASFGTLPAGDGDDPPIMFMDAGGGEGEGEGEGEVDATVEPGRDAGRPVTPPMRDAGPPDAGPPPPPPDTGPPPAPGACTLGPPLDAPIPGCSPELPPSTGDPYEDCVRRINQFRCECQHLQPLMRWHDGEACADMQCSYDAMTGEPHSGFRAGICSGGRAQNECPRWGDDPERIIGGCLQLMWDEGPGEPFSAHGHYLNMSSTSFTHVACGFADGWAIQNFY
jgi:hypothetical protein